MLPGTSSRGFSRQIVEAGNPTGRGTCGSTSMNTASCCSQWARASSVDKTVAPCNVAGVGER